MNYLEWNFLIAKHYFNRDMAGRQVVLFADASVIEEIGAPDGVGLDDFIIAVKTGPDWVTRNSLCQKAIQTFNNWRVRMKYPPYIAYLILFIVAACMEGDFSSIAYYPKLNKLLGMPEDSGMPPSFNRLFNLWLDLETWSIVDKNESYGRFTARVRGGWCHIGFPLSQAVLTNSEKSKLPMLFADYDLDPTSIPSDSSLAEMLQNSALLNIRTRRLFQSKNNDDIYLADALVEIVKEELKAWDGTIVENNLIDSDEDKNSPCAFNHAILRLCLSYEPLEQKVSTWIRFRTNKSFPEQELSFTNQKSNQIFTSKEYLFGWSTIFYENNKPLDASNLDWINGELFIDGIQFWKAKLVPSKVRVLGNLSEEGLNGWGETRNIEPNKEYLLACYEDYYEAIVTWGESSCKGFRKINVSGLPKNWHMFKLNSVSYSHPEIQNLKLPTLLSLKFEGGLKSGRGNIYFNFAPPKIVADGSRGDEILKLNGFELSPTSQGIWEIPNNLSPNIPLRLSLESGREITSSRTITLEEPHLPEVFKTKYRDKFGRFSNNEEFISGLHVTSLGMNEIPPYIAELPTYLSNRIIFLGRIPGEIIEWPESTSMDWTPVWAIIKTGKDRWKPIFVGGKSDLVFQTKNVSKKNDWKKWKKKMLYLNIQKPTIKTLARLWESYIRVARGL